jgi:hypothetical protein
MLHVFFACLAICCGMAAVIVVCIWAKDPQPDGPPPYGHTYLGTPEWTDNYFPSYHPVLMVAGFYFAQVLGICMWSLIPEHHTAKVFHVCFMLGAVATMIAGLHAVVAYEWNLELPSLTSMHSWVGVITVIVFGVQVIGGLTLGGLSAVGSTMPIMKHIVQIHRGSGIMSLMMTSFAILTGIQNFLVGPAGTEGSAFRGTCGYFKGNEDFNLTPERYYLDIAPGCRLGFGLGVLVLLGAIMTGMTVYTRSMLLIGMAEKEVIVAQERAVPPPQHEYTNIHLDPAAPSNNGIVE